MEEVRNYGKIVYIKNIFEMANGRMHSLHPTPLAISYRNHQKSLAYFSHFIGIVNFVLFYKWAESKVGGGAWHYSPRNAGSAGPEFCLSSPQWVLQNFFKTRLIIKKSLLMENFHCPSHHKIIKLKDCRNFSAVVGLLGFNNLYFITKVNSYIL